MPKYQIIASDLDGTLLNSAGIISEENLAAIRQLTAMGVHFVPASGRSFAEMPQQIRDCTDIRYVIYSNGAAVLDRKTGERILCCLSKEESNEILDIIGEYDVHITLRQGGECYVDAGEQGPEKYAYYHIGHAHAQITWDYGIHRENFGEFSYTLGDVDLYAVHFHDAAERIECRDRLLALGKYAIAEANPRSLEISAKDAGKGWAIHRLADHLGIDRADTIGMGDSDNDTTRIIAAGLGLVMKNGCDSLKKIADEIICNNNEHAVKYVLEHYIEK